MCNRELARKGEAEEVIKGLEEQTRAILLHVKQGGAEKTPDFQNGKALSHP